MNLFQWLKPALNFTGLYKCLVCLICSIHLEKNTKKARRGAVGVCIFARLQKMQYCEFGMLDMVEQMGEYNVFFRERMVGVGHVELGCKLHIHTGCVV